MFVISSSESVSAFVQDAESLPANCDLCACIEKHKWNETFSKGERKREGGGDQPASLPHRADQQFPIRFAQPVSMWTGQSLIQFFRFLKLISTPCCLCSLTECSSKTVRRMPCYLYVLTEKKKRVERQRFRDTPSKECEMCLWKKEKKKKVTQPETKQRCCTRE